MPGIQQNPDAKPHDMQIEEGHAAGKIGHAICDAVLHALFACRLPAHLNDLAYVALYNAGQSGIVFFVIGDFFLQ